MKASRNIKKVERASKTIARLMLYLVCFSFASDKMTAKAQTTAILFLLPNPQTTYLNSTTRQFSVELRAENVVNMQGYEFELIFDPSLLEFVKVTPGLWVYPYMQLPTQNNPGRIKYAYAKVGAPALNGNGLLMTITFNAIEYGNNNLTFGASGSCKYTNPDGIQIPFVTQNGIVSTVFDPATIASSIVIGTLSLQGQSTTSGLRLTLDEGLYLDRGPFSGTSLNQTGTNLSISPVVMDLYTVTTAQPRYLNIDDTCGKTKAVFGTTSTLNPLRLKGGNAIWTDNEINMQDVTAITGAYGQSSTINTPLDADINANGTVDIYDLAMVAANYGLTCATAYADWTP